MKKYIAPIVVALALSGAVLAVPVEKVTICHATSSETNPWTRVVVSANAIGGHFDNPGTPKAGHEDDVLLQGDVACSTVTVNPTPSPVVPPNPSVTPPPAITPGNPTVTQSTITSLPAVGADGL